ncbi:MAG TPA: hypothetical protein VF817_03900 [Patescibacteria group bacterium]
MPKKTQNKRTKSSPKKSKKTSVSKKTAGKEVVKKAAKRIAKKTTRTMALARRKKEALFHFGNISKENSRILVLVVMIIFVCTMLIITQMTQANDSGASANVQIVQIKKETPIQKEIKEMVQGYPIQDMTPFILQQDPKVAAFLIAIAKKESAWGLHHPVLNGQDCYNYWGFRLKSDKMGSGGHTCFDSPKDAVDTVAARLNELVKVENIDSPKEMIVWKCGYGCQDKTKTAEEQKWIKDVNIYYSTLTQNL